MVRTARGRADIESASFGMMKIALATSTAWPNLSPDDANLGAELAAAGFDAKPAVWSEPSIDWSAFDLVIIRSCWDYHLRCDDFLAWTKHLEKQGVAIANTASTVKWNAHKSYLFDLERKGVRVPATLLLKKGAKAPRPEEKRLVIKPAISASAHETHLVDASHAAAVLDRLLAQGDVIVQEFVSEVTTDGEWSLIYFDRELSHSVKKEPRRGDFRVQEEHGGSSEGGEPPASVLLLAEQALNAVDEDLLYARVDIVERPSGALLMELELIEPGLFFGKDPLAGRRFAAAVKSWTTAAF